MFLTHRKDLLKGDILIDDTRFRGQPDFEGEWIHFGQVKRVKTLDRWSTKSWKDWDSVMKYIAKRYLGDGNTQMELPLQTNESDKHIQ
jgi:5'(3')-deoxyribonucleotidase